MNMITKVFILGMLSMSTFVESSTTPSTQVTRPTVPLQEQNTSAKSARNSTTLPTLTDASQPLTLKEKMKKLTQYALRNEAEPFGRLFQTLSDDDKQRVAKATVNVPSKKIKNLTLLHIAAKKGNQEIAEHLVNAQADVNAHDGYKLTPLVYAAGMNHENMVNYLSSLPGQKQPEDSTNALEAAAQGNHWKTVDNLKSKFSYTAKDVDVTAQSLQSKDHDGPAVVLQVQHLAKQLETQPVGSISAEQIKKLRQLHDQSIDILRKRPGHLKPLERSSSVKYQEPRDQEDREMVRHGVVAPPPHRSERYVVQKNDFSNTELGR